MGACIGKKSSKYLKHNHSQPDNVQIPQIIVQDSNVEEDVEDKSSTSSSKKLPVINDSPINHDDKCRVSKLDEVSIDSELQIILNEQKIINETFSKPLPSRIISTTDTEFERELENLTFESTDNDHAENSLNVPTVDPNGSK